MSLSLVRRPRLVQWGLVALAVPVAAILWHARGEVSPSDSIVRRITLVTLDRDTLTCALNRDVEGYRCRYHHPGRRWRRDRHPPPAAQLAPYVTTDRMLLLVPGLFTLPELERRYHAEPPRGKLRETLRRFEAECRLQMVEKLDSVHVRFGRRAKWAIEKDVWVAVPLSCRVIERKK